MLDRRLPVLFLIIAALSGCKVYRQPVAIEESGFLERTVTQTDGEVTVTVGVPTTEEAQDLFGVKLDREQIQPVWIEVQNRSNQILWLMFSSVDPHYFSPLEAAFVRHTSSSKKNEAMDAHFIDQSIRSLVPANSTRSGFVFTNLDEGAKLVDLDLLTRGDVKSFTFAVIVPGLLADTDYTDMAALYGDEDWIDIDDEDELRRILEEMPSCTVNADSTKEGDPLNLVMIGRPGDIFGAMVRRDWHRTEINYVGSMWKTVKSFLFGTSYRYSPVSSLYVFDRPQDMAVQKARESITLRNHFRIWLTPYRYQGKAVFIGQISRDIGVRMTRHSPTLTTHVIDPDVDEARDGLIGDLAYSQAMKSFAFVKGAIPAPQSEPRQNLTGDIYYTDGLRVVMFFDRRPTSLENVEALDWEDPTGGYLESLVDGDETAAEQLED